MKISIKKQPNITLLIQEGQKVDTTTPYYEKNSTDHVKIPLATILRFPPDKIFMALHKLVGETVHKGDVLADYKGLFGIREYISEHTGTISEINHTDGSITINVHSEERNTIYCSFIGEVDEITSDIISLKVKEAKEYPIEETSHHFGGQTFYYNDSTKSMVTEDKVEHAVIIAENIPPYDQVKIEALGGRAFVTTQELPEKTSYPVARISRIQDYKNIIKASYPYCIISSDNTNIIFYK